MARLIVAFGSIAAAVSAFLVIGGEMSEGETAGWDRALMLALRDPGAPDNPLGPPMLGELMRDVTALGGLTLICLFIVIAFVTLWMARRRFEGLLLLGAVSFAQMSAEALKTLYGRPRPDLVPHAVEVYSQSFPSGHSTVGAAFYLTLAVIVAGWIPSRRGRIAVHGAALVVLTAIGVSRVYLGVHWPSDVAAGWALGAGWALLAGLILWRHRRANEQAVEV